MDPTTLALLGLVIVVIVMANLGERARGWRIAAYLAMFLMGVGAVLTGALFITRVGTWVALGGVACWVLLLGPVRRALAHIIPIRPASVVNAVALGLAALLLGQSIAVGGLGPQAFVALEGRITLAQVVLSEVPLALMGILGVGFLLRRTSPETWKRLGVGGLSARQLAASLAGVVGLLAFQVAIGALARSVAPQGTEELSRASRQLYAGLGTPLAALIVSLASGTAEEILFRGALQPRFGLLLTAVVFGIVHMQYGIAFALVTIGVVGLVLGIYRQRINTTSCIVIHCLYNLTQLLLSGLR